MELMIIEVPWEVMYKLLIVILGLYEVITRVFPTVLDWTIVGNIIKVLRWISDGLNNRKK